MDNDKLSINGLHSINGEEEMFPMDADEVGAGIEAEVQETKNERPEGSDEAEESIYSEVELLDANKALTDAELPNENDPFRLIDAYASIEESSSSTDSSERALPSADSNEAFKILVTALKVGNDRFFPLAKLLLPHIHSSSEDAQELKALEEKALDTIDIRQHGFIIAAMQTVVSVTLEFAEAFNVQSMTLEDYYLHLIEQLNALKHGCDLQNDFEMHVGRCVADKQEKQTRHRTCFTALSPFFPTTVDEINQKECYFYLDQGLDSLHSKIETLKKDLTAFGNAANGAHIKIEDMLTPLEEKRDQIYQAHKEEIDNLVTTILAQGGRQKEAGIPYQYQGQYTREQLVRFAGLVSFERIESETQASVGLLALQYKNFQIYKNLIRPNADVKSLSRVNKKQLSAVAYDAALSITGRRKRRDAGEPLEKLDRYGSLLRDAEMAIHDYLTNWNKKNRRLNAPEDNRSALEAITVFFIKIMNNDDYFKARKDEAEEYLKLINEASITPSNNFYQGLVHQLSTYNRRSIDHSVLHGSMSRVRSTIDSNPDLLSYFNPNEEVLRRLMVAEARAAEVAQENAELEQRNKELTAQINAAADTGASPRKKVDLIAENMTLRERLDGVDERAAKAQQEAMQRQETMRQEIEQEALQRQEAMKQEMEQKAMQSQETMRQEMEQKAMQSQETMRQEALHRQEAMQQQIDALIVAFQQKPAAEQDLPAVNEAPSSKPHFFHKA